jgi:hypothetical protein
MRSRSTSIYAKRPPERLNENSRKSWAPGMRDEVPDFPDIPEVQGLRKHHSVGSNPVLFEDFGPMCKVEFKDNFIGDFDKKGSNSKESHSPDNYNHNSRTSTFMSSLSFGVDHELAEFQDSEEQKQKIFRGMFIGSRNVGKRSLINAMFPSSEESFPEKKEFDLVMRAIETETCGEKYRFWLKEPMRDGKYPQCLFNTYYKSCSMFFFVYDVDDKASLDPLEKELKLILQALGTDKDHMFILIGNKKEDSGESNVTGNEAAYLKEKYNMKLQLEVNIMKETPLELKCLVECFLKELH